MTMLNDLTRAHLSTLGLEEALVHSDVSASHTYVWLATPIAADRLATDFRERGFETEVRYSRHHQAWVAIGANG